MPRGRPGGGALPRHSTSAPATGLGLSAIPTVTPDHQILNYDAMLADAGVFREGDGLYHYQTVVGGGTSPNGRPTRRKQKYPVALTAESARILTKTTGTRHDWFCPGLQCKLCADPMVGWVLGGRKFAGEHDHVITPDPTLYHYEEVEDEAEDVEQPVAVEA